MCIRDSARAVHPRAVVGARTRSCYRSQSSIAIIAGFEPRSSMPQVHRAHLCAPTTRQKLPRQHPVPEPRKPEHCKPDPQWGRRELQPPPGMPCHSHHCPCRCVPSLAEPGQGEQRCPGRRSEPRVAGPVSRWRPPTRVHHRSGQRGGRGAAQRCAGPRCGAGGSGERSSLDLHRGERVGCSDTPARVELAGPGRLPGAAMGPAASCGL